MKVLVALLVLVAFAVAVPFEPSFNTVSFVQFQEFKLKYGKVYTPEEEQIRFEIFKDNLRVAEELNRKNQAATYGVTKFSDLTPKEFKDHYLMNVTLDRNLQKSGLKDVRPPQVPSSFDWKSKGVVTGVKNQGQCGSCWDFSATETIESVCAIAGYPLTILSEQQILDCDQSDYGCNGGWPYNAYNYVIQAGGLETEAEYPYTASDGTCNFNKNLVTKCRVSKWTYVTQNEDEDQMQSFLYQNSPISVCVDAESWQYYQSGVITTNSDCGTSIDHCVQVTGWQEMQGMTVWNVRNSWGTDWGESGYLYVEKGGDVCAIAQVVTVPCVVGTSGSVVC